jgi:hypothetical protein
MMNYQLISTLRFLNVGNDVKGRMALLPGVDLITHRKTIKSIINKDFKKHAGLIEYDHYLNADHILYMETNDKALFNNANSNGALSVWLSWIAMLLDDVWLIKDNSIICESAYCRLANNGITE